MDQKPGTHTTLFITQLYRLKVLARPGDGGVAQECVSFRKVGVLYGHVRPSERGVAYITVTFQ